MNRLQRETWWTIARFIESPHQIGKNRLGFGCVIHRNELSKMWTGGLPGLLLCELDAAQQADGGDATEEGDQRGPVSAGEFSDPE